MAKKSLLSLLFSFFVANFLMLNATNLENASTILTDTCEAPPPDSFRILEAGAHYVTLAWNPIDPMATYTIVVQKEGGNANSWENVDTISNVTGSSITIQNLLYGSKYQFELATNCENGDPSKFKIYAGPPVGVILDLVLNGKTPVNPVPVPNCQAIMYENFNWVGFKVESAQNLGSDLNYFEFGIGDNGVPQIERTVYGPKIVATDNLGVFPLFPPGMPIISLDFAGFYIKRVDGPIPHTIGYVNVHYNPGLKTVKFCKDDLTWSPGYKFTPMTATIANGFQQIGTIIISDQENITTNEISIENPVGDYFHVWTNSPSQSNKTYSIHIFDLLGRVILEKKGEIDSNELKFEASNISPGAYTLVFSSEGVSKSFKVVKN